MSGECGPTLVAAAVPDDWAFLETPNEQAVDFFHAHLGEVADRRDRLVRSRHPARRAASTRLAIRYLRDRATTKTATAILEREVLPQAQALPTRVSRPRATGVVRQQGAGQSAYEAGALEGRRRPERPRRQGDAVPRGDRNRRRERQR